MTATRLDARTLAAATPADRDRVVDAVRVAALSVVILGHWVMAVARWDEGELITANLLAVAPWTRRATWLLQVMPLFFVVAGVANAASWSSARRRQTSWATWMRGRLDRVLAPVSWFVATWTVLLLAAHAGGVDTGPLRTAARLVAMPLWFLAVHQGVTALTPVAVALDRRLGAAAVLPWAVGALVIDLAVRLAGTGALGWANYAFVWLACHQVGWSWRAGRLRAVRVGMVVAAGGLAALVVLTTAAGYPVAMVGLPGTASNTSPPTIALLAVGALQVGLLALARPRLDALLRRPAAWRVVVVANGIAVTTFLWHLTALCLAVITVLRAGVFGDAAPGSASWWWLRPLWVLLLTLLTVPLVAAFARHERRRTIAAATTAARAGLATALAVSGLTLLALEGLPLSGAGLIPLAGVAAIGGATVVLGPVVRTGKPPP